MFISASELNRVGVHGPCVHTELIGHTQDHYIAIPTIDVLYLAQ